MSWLELILLGVALWLRMGVETASIIAVQTIQTLGDHRMLSGLMNVV